MIGFNPGENGFLAGSSINFLTQIMLFCHCSPVTKVYLAANLHSLGDNSYHLLAGPGGPHHTLLEVQQEQRQQDWEMLFKSLNWN